METIDYFYLKEEGVTLVDDQGTPILKQRGQLTSPEQYIEIIKRKSPQKALDAHLPLVCNYYDWLHYDRWKASQDAFEEELANTIEHNENLEEGEATKELPVEPPALEFTPMTIESAKALFKKELDTLAKEKGEDVNGTVISLTEANQNGLSAVLKGVELAAKHSVNIFPLNFKADTVRGTVTIPFESQDEFELFALSFMAKRQAYFT